MGGSEIVCNLRMITITSCASQMKAEGFAPYSNSASVVFVEFPR